MDLCCSILTHKDENKYGWYFIDIKAKLIYKTSKNLETAEKLQQIFKDP